MTDYHREIHIQGDPEAGIPAGVASIQVERHTRLVTLELPTGGGGQRFRFIGSDWDRMVDLINKAERERGQIVSTEWRG
jgi:hypothetical protein